MSVTKKCSALFSLTIVLAAALMVLPTSYANKHGDKDKACFDHCYTVFTKCYKQHPYETCLKERVKCETKCAVQS